ncbi:MAG: hypothetical protein MK212_07895 [Saprospiraceae bacterium]|nr:hypothetical protein [Saprospiraceae bacterium]
MFKRFEFTDNAQPYSFMMHMKKQYLPFRYIYILCCCLPFMGQAQSTYEIKKDIAAIYTELQEATGNVPTNWPRLEISTKPYCVAAYIKDVNTIVFEKDAYLVCQGMGKNKNAAIAFLLGHELTHFFQEHKWERQGFLMPNSSMNGATMREYEADTHGAFIAYLAGYAVAEVVGPLLDEIYKSYNLTDAKLKDKYPPLSTRKGVAIVALKKSEDLQTTYEAANYFIALGWHTEAIYCYKYLLEQIQTKELYNNLGTAFLASAIIQARKKDKYTFLYPMEIDSDFSVFGDRGLTMYLDDTELLDNAIVNFQKAILLDKDYFSAQLNQACAHDLLKSYRKSNTQNPWTYVYKADEIAAKNPSRFSSVQLSKIAIIKGILSASEYNDSSIYYFDVAVRHGWNIGIGKLANQNKKIAKNRKNENFNPRRIISAFSENDRMKKKYKGEYVLEDAIDYIDLRYTSNLTFDTEIQGGLLVGANTQPSIGLKYLGYSQLINIKSLTGSSILHFTKDKSTKTDRGIRVGSSITSIKKAYSSEPFKIINQNNGYFLVYPHLRLIFDLNEEQYVRGWGIYVEY